MSSLRAARLVCAATALALAPSSAVACAVCFSGRADETRIAFLVTTILLTALPLLLIGTLVWWLRRRARQLREQAEAVDPLEARG